MSEWAAPWFKLPYKYMSFLCLRATHNSTTNIFSFSSPISYSSISYNLIMAVFTFEDQTTSPVPPATLYKALVKDADDIVPKAVDSFKSVEIVEGNGGPGTIKKISFLEGTLFIHFLYILCTCINTVYSI